MKVEISVPEVVSIFKEIQEYPEKFFGITCVDIRKSVSQYLSKMMEMERTHLLRREPYSFSDFH